MNQMSIADIAYMAGVFDGEGWFVASNHADPGAFIAMTDFDIVDKLHEKSGFGRLETPRATRTGKKLQKKWAITKHEEVEEFINLILPFLGERRSVRALEVLAEIQIRRDKREWRLDHFICGHLKTEDNTYHFPADGPNNGKTACITCTRSRSKSRSLSSPKHPTTVKESK